MQTLGGCAAPTPPAACARPLAHCSPCLTNDMIEASELSPKVGDVLPKHVLTRLMHVQGKSTASGSDWYDKRSKNKWVPQMLAQVPHVSASAGVRAHCRDEGI